MSTRRRVRHWRTPNRMRSSTCLFGATSPSSCARGIHAACSRIAAWWPVDRRARILDPLGAEAPTGWIVTGYPWYSIDTASNKKFVDAYQAKYQRLPAAWSVVGYSAMMSIAAGIRKAGSTDPDKLAAAFKGLGGRRHSGRLRIGLRIISRRWGLMLGSLP